MTPHRGPRNAGARRRSWPQRALLGFNLFLIGSSLLAAGALGYAGNRAASIDRVALDRSLTELDEISRGQRVLNVLLVGSDSSANLDPDDPIQIGRQGERLGDVIIIAHIDERSGAVALLSLPRDLWVPIAGSERDDRINRAFLVGGAATLIDTIEETFGIPIHHYVNVDFAGFEELVEAIGSVDVYFETPARDWNVNAEPEPASQTGFEVLEPGCHSLGPRQALAYVRSRYYQTQNEGGEWVTDPTSDLGRIRRQQDLIRQLLHQAIELGARNPLVLADLIDVAIQSVTIDQELTPGELLDLSVTYRGFEPGDLQSYTFPADDGNVGASRVLVPRHDDAAPLVALFNGEPFDAPSTVRVRVVHDPALDRTPRVGAVDGLPRPLGLVMSLLADAGFEVGTPGSRSAEPGLRLQHGPDGRQAAEVVAAALESSGQAIPVDAAAPLLAAGLAYNPLIGSQLVPGQAAAGPLTSQHAGELGYHAIFEETSALSGRDVVVAVGATPAVPPASLDPLAPSMAGDQADLDAGERSAEAIAADVIDPGDPPGPRTERAGSADGGAGHDEGGGSCR